MKAFIAVVKVEAGKIAKLMDFDNEEAATAHVSQYGGFVAANPGGSFEFWEANAAAKTLAHNSAAENAVVPLQQIHAARRQAYGSFGDQLDMQYHDLLDDTTTWKDHIAKVKSDNPKPE